MISRVKLLIRERQRYYTVWQQQLALLYKSQYRKIIAVLVKLFGIHNIQLAEDVAQDAFNKALLKWPNEMPDNPCAWLLTVAKNQAYDVLRKQQTHDQYSMQTIAWQASNTPLARSLDDAFAESQIQDDQLRLIFCVCQCDINIENRIGFALNVLCGLSSAAIARALLLKEETVKKRLYRTKKRLAQSQFELPENHKLNASLEAVHTILYLLFNEGYLSSSEREPFNEMLCADAIGMTKLLLLNDDTFNGETLALLALMQFHFARFNARKDSQGKVVSLDLQQRSLWCKSLICEGQELLVLSLAYQPKMLGRFLIEAQIAQLHCMTADFKHTPWSMIIRLYSMLYQVTGSAHALLNKAIALGYAGQCGEAIGSLENLTNNSEFQQSHALDATLAHLYALKDDRNMALIHAELAKKRGGTILEHQIIRQQLQRFLDDLH